MTGIAERVRLHPTVYEFEECSRTWRPGIACGRAATMRILVACVHEHVRWVSTCAGCVDSANVCIICDERCGKYNHWCMLKIIRIEAIR